MSVPSLVGQPRITVAVQHVAEREVSPVYHRLIGELSYYPHKVITDQTNERTLNRTWHTYRRCLESCPFSATHLLVLQDDVSLCTNFIPAVKRIATSRPDDLIALFLGNKPSSSTIAYFQACDQDERYAPLDTNTWIPAQALLWPRFLIPPMLRFADEMYREGRPDDELIGQFCSMNAIQPFATIPTLVEHEGAFGELSTTGASGGHYRYAVCNIGQYDPLEIDW